MKKRILFSVAFALLLPGGAMAQDVVTLPAPSKNVEMSLYSALQQRRSVREYEQREVDNATLSQLLWAACGISRPAESKITAPSAINAQDIRVYVIRKEGAYLYDPANNTLTRKSSKDLRPAVAGRQAFATNVPLCLLLVSDQSKFGGRQTGEKLGAMDAGYVSQNIYLACTALGLGTVARETMDRETLQKALQLADDQVLELNHPVGWDKTPAKREKLPFKFEVVEQPDSSAAEAPQQGESGNDIIDMK